MIDLAPHIARHLTEHSALSVFDAADLAPIVAERWPGVTEDETRRALRIFLELRRADDDFERYGLPRTNGVSHADPSHR